MARAIGSDSEPEVEVANVDDLRRFVEEQERRCKFPVAVSVEAHRYRADLLLGHAASFVHLSPLDPDADPYYVTVGEATAGTVEFWLHGNHHTEFEARHLVPRDAARAAFVEFFRSGRRSPAVRWEMYRA